ncbi:MAG: hypothetical protein EOO13_07955 [Chitinophagaceae bacterium]|nr:MAG: hypothetical protein EOO13_07955 [Chitinophagaceae bacterium]
MNYILFFIVLIIACFLICRVPFIKKSGLGSRLIVALFLFKIAVGAAQAYINARFFPTSDTWGLNSISLTEYQLLLSDPSTFFSELVLSNYNGTGYDSLFGSYGSFWNDLEINLLAKSLAPVNVISHGNYYINSIFCNFFGFFGHIALYRVFSHIYKERRTAILLGCFGLPTFLFVSSAIGKDNVAFTMLAMFCFALYFFTLSGFSLKKILWLLFFFLGLLLMRNHIALLLMPPAVAFYYSLRSKKNPWKVFGIMVIILLALLVVLPMLIPAIDPGAVISQKQQDFIALGKASSQIELTPLEPTTAGLFKNFPEAVNHGFLRPYLWEAKNGFMLIQALELIGMLVVCMISIFIAIKNGSILKTHPFLLFCIMFCCLVFIMNGYIVPNSNTLVRYRSIYLPLLVIPALCNIWRYKYITLKNI